MLLHGNCTARWCLFIGWCWTAVHVDKEDDSYQCKDGCDRLISTIPRLLVVGWLYLNIEYPKYIHASHTDKYSPWVMVMRLRTEALKSSCHRCWLLVYLCPKMVVTSELYSSINKGARLGCIYISMLPAVSTISHINDCTSHLLSMWAGWVVGSALMSLLHQIY